MTLEKYQAAFYEIANNIGESYPYYRIVLHAIDNIFNRIFRMFHVKPLMKMSKWIKHDRPVCSEWIAQLYVAAKLLDEWAGINPDDFDDWRLKHPDKWLTIFEGKLIG